jgi:hypothetical protein
VTSLEKLSGDDIAAFKAQVESLAPAPRPRGGFRGFGGFRGGAPAGPPTLDGGSNALLGAAMSMQEADVTPTAREVAACSRARIQYGAVMARWNALRTSGLAALNAKRRAAGLPVVPVP